MAQRSKGKKRKIKTPPLTKSFHDFHNSQDFLEGIINAISNHIAVLDKTGKIVLVNQAWRNFADENPPISSNVHEGADYLDICFNATGPDSQEADAFGKGIQKILDGKLDRYSQEYPCHSPEKERWFIGEVSKFCINDECFVLVSHETITRRKLLEKSLEDSEELYRITFQSISDTVFITNDEGKFTFLCPNLSHIFGYTVDEAQEMEEVSALLGGNPLHQHDVNTYEELKNLEWKIQDKNNNHHDLLINIKPVDIRGGTVLYTCRDITDRKKTETILRESEAIHRALIESSNDFIYMLDRDGRYITANNKLKRFGQDKGREVIGRHFKELHPPEVVAYYQTQLDRVWAEKITLTFEHEMHEADGLHIHVDTLYPVQRDGTMWAVGGFCRDITEQKQAETALKASEERFQQVAEASWAWVWEMDETGKYTYASPVCEKRLGYKPSEIVGKLYYYDLIHPDDAEWLKTEISSLVENRRPFRNFENRLTHKNGDSVWMLTSGLPIMDADGRFMGYRGVGTDITRLKEAEEATHQAYSGLDSLVKERTLALAEANKQLQRSEEQVRLLLDSTAEAICGLDVDGKCTFFNKSSLNILGYKEKSDLIGKDFHTLIHHTRTDGTVYAKEDCPIYQFLKTGLPTHIDNEVMWRKDGTSFPVSYRVHPVYQGKEMSGAVITFLDITEKQLMDEEKQLLEERLLQAQKMEAIGTMAGGIAHDFNNILTAIIGFAELIEMFKEPAKSNIQLELDGLTKAAYRAQDLVKQILTFSRQDEQEKKPLILEPIIREALKLLRASIPSTVKFKQEIKKIPGTILGDPTQIHQIMMNLCNNAAYAMLEKGGTLTIRLSEIKIDKGNAINLKPGSYARLTVKDTGIGIPEEFIERIYDPYFTTKEKGEGTGLGLAMIHGIVEGYRGKIAVRSKEGEGTTFEVFLPLMKTVGPTMENQADTELMYGSGRILFVDDEKQVVDMAVKVLSYLGYDVQAETNSNKALAVFNSSPKSFDLVITDQTMPEKTGIELAREILKIRPEIPIVLCTGYSELVKESTAKAEGVTEFLHKPIGARRLGELVFKYLGKH